MKCSADRFLWPFPWPQRKSFTPEALYIVRSCHEQDNKKIFMSSPALRARQRLRYACAATGRFNNFYVFANSREACEIIFAFFAKSKYFCESISAKPCENACISHLQILAKTRFAKPRERCIYCYPHPCRWLCSWPAAEPASSAWSSFKVFTLFIITILNVSANFLSFVSPKCFTIQAFQPT